MLVTRSDVSWRFDGFTRASRRLRIDDRWNAVSVTTGSLKMSTHSSFSTAKEEFDKAWQNPNHTPMELEAVDVNALMQKSYSMNAPFRLTKSLMWDADGERVHIERVRVERNSTLV